MFGEGGGFFDQDRPVFGDGQFAVERGRAFTGGDADSYCELAFGAAAEHAMGRRHVGIVTTDGGAYMPIAGNEAVGGVEADPAEFGQKAFDPGVGGGVVGTILPLIPVVKVAADVAARNL